jgi:hypothetical protein
MNKQKLLSEIMKREQKIAQLSKKIHEYTSQKNGVQSELNELNRIRKKIEDIEAEAIKKQNTLEEDLKKILDRPTKQKQEKVAEIDAG